MEWELEEPLRRQKDDMFDVRRQNRHYRGEQALTKFCQHPRDGFLPGLTCMVTEGAIIGYNPFAEKIVQVALCEGWNLNHLDPLLSVPTHGKAHASLLGDAKGNEGRLRI